MAKNKFSTIWENQHTVLTNEVDLLQNITIPSILNIFQDLATQHADNLNFGYDYLILKNQLWVLSRIHIEIKELPVWKQQLRVQTWTRGVEGIFANRNWRFLSNGEKVVRAYADWLIINAETRKPVRPDFSDFENKLNMEQATEKKTEKIKLDEDMQLISTLEVRISELDMNEHVNNIYYFAWIVNALGLDWKKAYFPAEIDINYVHEVRYPSRVQVFCNKEKKVFSLQSEVDGTEYCRVKVKWQKV